MTTRPATVDVLVSGAGPTGLTMAAGLAARGVTVRIVDQAPERPDTSRALVVQARSLEVLQRMGLAEELIARGRPNVRVNVYIDGRHAVGIPLGDIGSDDTPFPFILFVSQAETERLLERHLTGFGVEVERPVEVLESFEEDGDGVTATLRRGDGRTEQVRARYLVGCDGAHSAVRHGAGLTFEGHPYPQDFVLADVVVDDWGLPADELALCFGKQGLLAAFPMGGQPPRHRLIALRDPARAEDGEPTVEEFEERAAGLVPGDRMKLRDPAWMTRFRLHHRGVDRYRAGRAFVAGDAAHIHSPVGGQGMNTGIQDADNLAWKLALVVRGRAPDALLDSYHAERHPVGQVLLRTTDRGFTYATSDSRAVAALRTFVVTRLAPRVLDRRSLRARAFRFVSELAIDYRRSPAVGEDRGDDSGGFRGGARPGYRAPDGPLRSPTGADGTVHEHLGGGAHRLLLFCGPHSSTRAWSVVLPRLAELQARYPGLLEPGLVAGRDGEPAAAGGGAAGGVPLGVDHSGLTHRRYGLRGPGYYLIRPDGYVAFRGPGTRVDALDRYLARTFLPG